MKSKTSAFVDHAVADESAVVFEQAAQLFSMLSTPIRLRILNTLCDGEKNVTSLLEAIPTTQSNLSQHLSTMFLAGILSKRREGNQMFYAIRNQQAVTVCRSVCNQIATDL